jgi:O-antigen ligase
MSVPPPRESALSPLPSVPARARPALSVALGSLGIVVALTAAFYHSPPSLGLVVAGGSGLLGILALGLARYDAAVVIGVFLIGAVKVEPAPSDGVFAVLIAVAAVTGRLSATRIPLSVGGLIGAFLALNLLSAVEALEPLVAGRFFAITLYLAVLGLWVCGYVDARHRARLLMGAYLSAATASALFGCLALFAPIPGRELLLTLDGLRAQALFEDPNVFGPFLVPPALVLIEEILRPRLLRLRLATKAALLFLLGAGVLFAYSRAAWLNLTVAVVVMLVVMAMRRDGARMATALLVTLVVAGAGVGGALMATGSLDFLKERASLQSYDSDRFGAQREGLRLAERYPFGIGPGQFELHSPVATHSTYVRAVAEQGVLGLATVFGLLLATLVLAARNAVLGRDTYGIGSAALLGAWCGLLANSLFVDTLHWRHLWVVAALVWAGAMRR